MDNLYYNIGGGYGRIIEYINSKFYDVTTMSNVHQIQDLYRNSRQIYPDFEFKVPALNCFQAKGRASDFAYSWDFRHALSQKAVDLIQVMKLPKYDIHPIRYLYRGEFYEDLYYINFMESVNNFIDFDKSVFSYHIKEEQRHVEVKINNLGEFIESPFGRHLSAKRIYLKDNNYDFFPLRIYLGFFCTNFFKEEYERRKLKGSKFFTASA